MVKIAYFIMAHQQIELLQRMLNSIYTPDHIYLIHIDSKADSQLHTFAGELVQHHPNIHVLPSRSLTWGLWSLVQCELDALTYLLHTDKSWTHFINLSGQDFPLVKQSFIESFLEGNRNNYVRYKLLTDNPVLKSNQQAHYFIEDCGVLKELGPREPFEHYFADHIVPYYGSQWKILHRSFAEYAASSYLSFEMQDYFRYTLIPDECFFPTLIMNSPFKQTAIDENHRYFKMVKHHEVLLSPSVLTANEIIEMYKSPAFFARKFDLNVDAGVIQILENVIKAG
ncbi:beta-1,6-N-acetylglucosaminyltransferase [Paenibacillus pinistramenti]|uniref:beta-1,6-N-acetylglucosaminyltransferase n=1 Tax=Paenibacillus pinistramenti TaxID=1768003 RepID=UPI001108966A|nr:beta-1,6-N-acetylglucosaminyltransferase [Paenibacillus pinistramenti]